MIINSVHLHNFKSHADTGIEFGTGINVILGENGAGKTSVLEAISFALFKEYGGSLENLVRRGKSEMAIELVFTTHGRRYKVVRSRTSRGSNARLYLLDGGEKLLQEGDSGVDSEIANILGIDKYLFSNAVYVRQGEIARLLVARPAEKKQLIGRLLGIDILERVWTRMRLIVDTYKDRKSRAEVKVMEEGKVRGQLQEIKQQMEEVNARISTTKKKITGISAQLEKAESAEKGLAQAEKKYLELSGVRDSVKTALDRERERLDSVKREILEIKEAQLEIKEIQKKLVPGLMRELREKIKNEQKKISEINEKIGALRGKVSEIRELEARLAKAGNKCPLCGSELTERHRQELLKENELKIKENEDGRRQLLHDRASIELELESLAKKRDGMTELEKRNSELKGIASRYDSGQKFLHKIELEIKELTRKLDSTEKKIKSLEFDPNAYAKTKEHVNELRSELGAIEKAHSRQQGKLQELENAAKRLKLEVKEIHEKRLEYGKLTEFIKTLNEIRSLFDKSGLQRELRIQSGPVIEEHMKQFFREFNFDYSDLSLDENYDVTLYGPAGESTTEMMSGGEKIAAALAMRLGIARTLVGGSAESMLLDEPTIFLDNQRRQDLIEVLKRLSIMPQLIVVTHDTAMEEAADKISMLKKSKGVSFVEES